MIRLWTVTTAARRAALARRSRQSAVQAGSHVVPVSEEPSTEILRRLLRSGLVTIYAPPVDTT